LPEILVEGATAHLVRRRQTYAELVEAESVPYGVKA
jgi:hypothetical protein